MPRTLEVLKEVSYRLPLRLEQQRLVAIIARPSCEPTQRPLATLSRPLIAVVAAHLRIHSTMRSDPSPPLQRMLLLFTRSPLATLIGGPKTCLSNPIASTAASFLALASRCGGQSSAARHPKPAQVEEGGRDTTLGEDSRMEDGGGSGSGPGGVGSGDGGH